MSGIGFNSIGGHQSSHQLGAVQNRMGSHFSKLASGRRITSAADDAAGLAIAERMGAARTGINQGIRNLHDGVSVARVAEGGLEQTSSNLIRMRELTVQAGNGTLNSDDRAMIQQEFDQLAAEVSRVSEVTEFNGRSLLNGDTGGSGSLAIEDGSGGESLQLDIGDQSATALGIDGLDVSDSTSLAAIDQAINSVSSTRASIGAFSNRAEFRIEGQRVAEENLAAAESRIRDLDIAKETSERTKDSILFEAQLGLRAQANLASQSVMRLIG